MFILLNFDVSFPTIKVNAICLFLCFLYCLSMCYIFLLFDVFSVLGVSSAISNTWNFHRCSNNTVFVKQLL